MAVPAYIPSVKDSNNPPTNYGVLLFPGFQLLDIGGPLDFLNELARIRNINLYLIAQTLDPVSTLTSTFGKPGVPLAIEERIVPTHTYQTVPADLEVLLVPGGRGVFGTKPGDPIFDFIKNVYPKLRYLLTVCTGSGLVAQTGLLDGLRATTNKAAWDGVIVMGPKVHWVSRARWVVAENNKIWSSSGVQAGMDLFVAFLKYFYDDVTVLNITNADEYEPNYDSNEDPFAGIWQVKKTPWDDPNLLP